MSIIEWRYHHYQTSGVVSVNAQWKWSRPGVYSEPLINNLNKLTDEIYSLAVSVSQLRFIYHLLPSTKDSCAANVEVLSANVETAFNALL